MDSKIECYKKLAELTKDLTAEEVEQIKFAIAYLKAHPGEPLPPFEEMHELYLSTKSAA